jgi:NitT/TauT family transport system substrate-binding protein
MQKLKINLILVLCLMISIGSSHARGQNLRIGWVYAMANAPIVIAKDMGLFKAQGVDVDIRQFNSGPLLMRALKAGDLDMAYIGMPPVYHAYEQGFKLKIIAKVNHGQAALIVHNDSDITDLAQLKGKKIAGVRESSGMDVLLKGFVLQDKANLDPVNDVKIIHMPTKMMSASVARGVVDAAFSWEPFISQAVLSKQERVLFDMNQAVEKYPWYVVVATQDTISQNYEMMSKVLKAHQQAVLFLNEQPEASNTILAKIFNLYAVNKITGKKVAPVKIIEHARARIGWNSQFDKRDKEFLQRLIDYSHQLGFIKTKIKADAIIDENVTGNVFK